MTTYKVIITRDEYQSSFEIKLRRQGRLWWTTVSNARSSTLDKAWEVALEWGKMYSANVIEQI